jgi:hypothetical protein
MNECHHEIKKYQDVQSHVISEQELIARRQLELKELDAKDQVSSLYLIINYLPSTPSHWLQKATATPNSPYSRKNYQTAEATWTKTRRPTSAARNLAKGAPIGVD